MGSFFWGGGERGGEGGGVPYLILERFLRFSVHSLAQGYGTSGCTTGRQDYAPSKKGEDYDIVPSQLEIQQNRTSWESRGYT